MLTLIAAALLTAGPAPQAYDRARGPVAALIGNSLEVRYGDQMMVTYFAADGTFKMKLPDGVQTSGDWVADDRHVCWITKVPAAPPGENIRCESAMAGKKVGDTWTQTDTYGNEARVSLVAGDRVAGQ